MAKRQHKKKRPYPVVIIGERATPERRKQLGGVMRKVLDLGADGKVLVDRSPYDCALDYYFQTGRLNDPQIMAGEKYCEMYNRAKYGYHHKVLKQPFLFDGTQSDPESRILADMDCKRKLREADDELSKAQRDIVVKVCGYGQRAGNKDYIETLKRALDILAEFWGYAAKVEK